MPVPRQSMSSVEAAALLISGGETRDPELANHMVTGGNPLDLDALQRAHLRRMMGFDFGIDVTYKKIKVYSKETPILEEEADYSGIMDEDGVDVLVDTCLALKTKWNEERANDE